MILHALAASFPFFFFFFFFWNLEFPFSGYWVLGIGYWEFWSVDATVRFLGFLFAAISSRSMMKFESGYTVETVFDGSKLGIEPYSIEVLGSGELLILDSANSNLYKISSSLSQCKWIYCNNLESLLDSVLFCETFVCNLFKILVEYVFL